MRCRVGARKHIKWKVFELKNANEKKWFVGMERQGARDARKKNRDYNRFTMSFGWQLLGGKEQLWLSQKLSKILCIYTCT